MPRVATANVKETLDYQAAARAFAAVDGEVPDFGGLQEWPSSRREILRDAGYHWARPDEGGGPVFWDPDEYHLVLCRAVVLDDGGWVGRLPGRKSTLPPSIATLVVLRDDMGRETTVINFHLTAEVQMGAGYRTTASHRERVRRHKREVRALGRVSRRQKRKGRQVYPLGDTNFDGLQIRGFVSCWTGRGVGTLGNRAVDVIYASDKPRSVQTIRTGSDHKAVVASYR